MRNQVHLNILLILLLSVTILVAQEKHFRAFTVDNGLAGNMVYNGYEDDKGFLWFCTESGVSRFDGTTFTNFTTLDGLSDNDVLGVFGDNEGRIWFKCFNQRPCFYLNGKIYNDKNFDELKKIESYSWYSQYVDKDVVWFPGDKVIYKFSHNKVEKLPFLYSNTFNILTLIDSNLIILDCDRVYQYNIYTNEVKIQNIIMPSLINSINTVVKFSNKKFGYFSFNGDQSSLVMYEYKNNTVNQIFNKVFDKTIYLMNEVYKTNQLWLSYNDNTSELYTIKDNTIVLEEQFKFNTRSSGLMVDVQGNKWFTLLGQGIRLLSKNHSSNISFNNIASLSTFLSVNGIGDEVYCGSDNGELIKINKNLQCEKIHYLKNTTNIKISHITIDKLNKIWINTDRNNVILDGSKTTIINELCKRLGSIKDVQLDSKTKNILISTHGGSYLIDSVGQNIIVKLNDKRTVSISGSKEDLIWIACIDGLYSYTNNQLQFEKSLSDSIGCRILKLRIDNRDILWVATNSNGVFGIRNKKILYHLTQNDGLNSNICKKIYVDKFQDVWVITNKGLSRIQLKGDRIFRVNKYNDKNCLLDNDVNAIYVSDTKVYIASGKGVCYFDNRIINSSSTFPLYINYIETNLHNRVYNPDKVVVSYLNNSITINFSGLSFLSGGEITYKYKISELNNDFLVTTNNSVTYNELQPGTYHFIVEAIDVFGNKSAKSVPLTITITPAWYQTFLFKMLLYLLAISLLIGLVYYFTRRNLNKKQKENELKQLISKLELEAIRSQINPHFIFNCLNAVQNSIFKENYEQASYFINKFATLMRKTLELSKESYISIEEEYDFINNYMEVEKFRMNDKFTYKINIDSKLDKTKSIIPAFILQPFIENAINHGVKYLSDEIGRITISFALTNNNLEIVVEDNGIGVNASKEIQRKSSSRHSSQGMNIIMRRAESLNNIYDNNITIVTQDKSDISVDLRGTKTTITLKLNYD